MCALQVARSLSKRFAAAVPVAGSFMKGFGDSVKGAQPVAIMDIHGWYDPWVPVCHIACALRAHIPIRNI